MRTYRGTVNRVELIGWLGDSPDQRVLASGAKVCTFSVATRRPGARTETGERAVETDWTSVEVWDKLADQCESLGRGSRVRVCGSLRTQSWEDRDSGQRRYRTLVRADEVLFLSARPEHPAHEPAEAAEDAEAVEEAEELPF